MVAFTSTCLLVHYIFNTYVYFCTIYSTHMFTTALYIQHLATAGLCENMFIDRVLHQAGRSWV